jgi:hypothetical protein
MMRFSLPTNRRRLVRLLGAGVLVTGGAFVPVLLAAGSAQAVTCSAALTAETDCTATGTLTMTSGDLTLAGAPASLTWGAALTGLDQYVVDGVGADQAYTVDDATGSAAGWRVTVSATTFTVTAVGAYTGDVLPDGTLLAPTFFTNGDAGPVSLTDVTPWATATTPTIGCATGSTCSVPGDTTTYPASIVTATTAPTPVVIFDTATPSDTVGTGSGSVTVGGAAALNPLGWWLNVPADAEPAAYVSLITMAVETGP